MDNENMDRVIKVLKEKKRFLLTAHVDPEGDSMGSQLALFYILKEMGKEAVLVDQDKVPCNIKFLPGADMVSNEIPDNFFPEVVVVLDCPVLERIGNVREYLKEGQLIVNVDHHISNEYYGDINWVESGVSSVGEMLFLLAEKMGVRINEEMAKAMYTAIVTDTGMFKYTNTSKQTHRVAGELVATGINPKNMFSEIFEKKSIHSLKLLGKVLNTLQVENEGTIAHISVTKQMYKDVGGDSVSTEEFIGFPRSIKGVEVALFFKESTEIPGRINVSFRSSGKVDVNAIAGCFGGGGHAEASGCIFNCSIEEAREQVVAEAKKALEAIKT